MEKRWRVHHSLKAAKSLKLPTSQAGIPPLLPQTGEMEKMEKWRSQRLRGVFPPGLTK